MNLTMCKKRKLKVNVDLNKVKFFFYIERAGEETIEFAKLY